MAESSSTLSVIVTTYTRERLADVMSLLDSLLAQTYPDVEILFVGERDQEICQQVRDRIKDSTVGNAVVLFNSGERGLSAARNVAIPYARGRIIAFLDDDVVAAPEWAEQVVGAFADPSVIGITGPALPLWDDPAMAWLPEELYWLLSCTGWSDSDQVREVRNAWGMNMAFKSEVFRIAGMFSQEMGFHRGIFAEDNEFSLRVKAKTGKRIIYIPGAKVWHRVHGYRLTWRFIRERAYWIGRTRRNMMYVYGGQHVHDLLEGERGLLRRILLHQIPKDLMGLVGRPRLSARRLVTTLWTLLFVASGYYGHLLPSRSRISQREATGSSA